MRLGWSRGDQEIFTLDEMIDLFGLEAVSRSAARFDPLKLLWVNHQHIQSVDAGRLAELLASQLRAQGLDPANGPPLPLTVKALSERSQTVLEMAERANCYYGEFEEFDAKSAKAHLRPVARNALAAVRETLEILETWTEESAQAAVETVADRLELKLGKVAQPLRVALTAKAASPGIGTTLMLVGRERALLRIDRALAYIDARAAGQ